MRKIRELNIKNQTYYFFNNIMGIQNFHSNLLKIDKKPYKAIDIYYIGYITIKKMVIVKIFTALMYCIY